MHLNKGQLNFCPCQRHQHTFYKSTLDLRFNNILFCSKLAMAHYCYGKWTWSCIQQHVVYIQNGHKQISDVFLCPKPRINFAIFLSIRTVTLWWLNWEYHTLLNRGKNTKGSTSNSNAIIWYVLFPSTYAHRGRRPFLSEK